MIVEALKRRRDNDRLEREMLEHSESEIILANGVTVRRISDASSILMVGLVLVALLVPSFSGLWPIYAFMLTVNLAAALLLRRGLNGKPALIMPVIYGSILALFTMALHLSAFVTPESIAITGSAVLLLVPMVLVDRSRRVAVLMGCYYLALVLCAYFFKTYELFLDDMVNGFVYLLLGLISGRSMRTAKLRSIEAQRLLTHQRNTDELTGLMNRRRLFELLAESEDPACETPVTGVLMLDIDRFKLYNDTYGHQAGDDCLRTLGECFRRFGEQRGLTFFRYGGEEFLAFSRAPGVQALDDTAEALCAAVRALQIPFRDAPCGETVTVSVGHACAPADELSGYEALIARADKALYCAKAEGRGRAVRYSDRVEELLPEMATQYRSSLRQRRAT